MQPSTSRATLASLATIIVALLVVAGAACARAPRAAALYHCPMHPTYVSDKPGDCPICNMRLVPIKGAAPAPTAPDPAPVAATAAADPPAAAADAGTGRKILFYRNPMNPKVTSPVPAKDEMGMDYVPVYAEEVAPAAVPGLAPVELSPEGMRLAGVQLATAVREHLARSIRTVGTVVPDETRIRHFHTRVTGWVEKLYVDFTGQYVRKGQPVMSIYSPQLLATQEEYLQARADAARFAVSTIPEVRRGGEDLVRAARRRLELLDVPDGLIAEIERTGKPSRDVTLLARASGYVTAKGVFEGQEVSPSMMDLFTITDLSTVWIEGQFYEYEASALRLGEQAVVTLPYDPGVRLIGRVSYIDPTLDPATRTLTVRFAFPNPKLLLKPGMFANVELAVGGREGVVIPDSAVIDTGLRRIVFVSLGGGRFAPREVTLGVRGDGKAEVESGLAAGEQVVVGANFLIDSESQLRAAIGSVAASQGGKQ